MAALGCLRHPWNIPCNAIVGEVKSWATAITRTEAVDVDEPIICGSDCMSLTRSTGDFAVAMEGTDDHIRRCLDMKCHTVS